MKSKRFIATLLAVGMVFLISIPIFSAGVQEQGVGEKPKLTVWQLRTFTPAFNEAYYQRYAEFARENNVEIDVVMDAPPTWPSRWQVALETRVFGDVVILQPAQPPLQLRTLGLLLDITDVAERLDRIGSGFDRGALDPFTDEKGVYAIPMFIGTHMMYYRKDWLNEVGYDVPDTWEEVFEAAEALTIPGKRYGIGLDLGCDANNDLTIPSFLLSYGGSAWDKDGKPAINSPGSIRWLNDWKAAWDRGIFPQDVLTWTGAGNNQSYYTETCAIIYDGASPLSWLRDNDPQMLDKTVTTLPPKGRAGRFHMANAMANFIWKGTKYPEQAKALLEHLHHPEFLAKVYETSGNTAMQADARDLEIFKDPLMAPLASTEAIVPVGYPGPSTPWAAAAFRPNYECQMLSKVLVDGWSPEQAAEWAQGELQKIFDEFH
jgi:multiple sugar transport system substrate-binding protein